MARVALDFVPELAQPPEIGKAIDEAKMLRDRLRHANEELAAAEAEYVTQQQADAASAAERARKGAALGAVPPAVEKARHGVELAKRNAAALDLASRAAQDDAASAILASADDWRAELDNEVERARDDGRAAIAAAKDALVRIAEALAAKSWVNAGSDGNFEHRPTGVWTASTAPSSARRTANSAALNAQEILDYLAELIDPPSPQPRRTLGLALDTSGTSA
jgi:hypothetical protein